METPATVIAAGAPIPLPHRHTLLSRAVPFQDGDLGELWTARDTALNSPVLLHFLRPLDTPTPTTLATLRAHLARLQPFRRDGFVAPSNPHEHAQLWEDHLALVLDPLKEHEVSLRAWLDEHHERGQRPPTVVAWQILQELCGVLRVIHEASPPLAHGRLTAAEVLLLPRGFDEYDVRVMSVGLAPFHATTAHAHGLAPRPWDAMAPEQRDASFSADAATDVFALGVIAVELLTGRPTDEHGTPWWRLAITPESSQPALRRLLALHVDPTVIDVIACALRERADTRFQTAGLLFEALTQAKEGTMPEIPVLPPRLLTAAPPVHALPTPELHPLLTDTEPTLVDRPLASTIASAQMEPPRMPDGPPPLGPLSTRATMSHPPEPPQTPAPAPPHLDTSRAPSLTPARPLDPLVCNVSHLSASPSPTITPLPPLTDLLGGPPSPQKPSLSRPSLTARSPEHDPQTAAATRDLELSRARREYRHFLLIAAAVFALPLLGWSVVVLKTARTPRALSPVDPHGLLLGVTSLPPSDPSPPARPEVAETPAAVDIPVAPPVPPKPAAVTPPPPPQRPARQELRPPLPPRPPPAPPETVSPLAQRLDAIITYSLNAPDDPGGRYQHDLAALLPQIVAARDVPTADRAMRLIERDAARQCVFRDRPFARAIATHLSAVNAVAQRSLNQSAVERMRLDLVSHRCPDRRP